jgi:RNA polymerase sigma-70 factor (ECF subfamily)
VNSEPGEVTQLLAEIRGGNHAAEERLITLVYDELRRLAGYYMRGERTGHTLQPTALVHEAYLRLTSMQDLDWHNRSHFFAVASQVMRRILVDHARTHLAEKRGGNFEKVNLEGSFEVSLSESEHVVALDEALDKLSQMDARQGRIVELRFFGGLTEEEVGKVLGISERTVKREWRTAKAWLYEYLTRQR